MSNLSLLNTGVDTAYSPLVRSRWFQYTAPVAGSSDVTDSCVQTMSCRFPPDSTMIGELDVNDSSSARQNSCPVSLLSASTQAPGLPPMNSISSLPSISGDGAPGDQGASYSVLKFFSQTIVPD